MTEGPPSIPGDWLGRLRALPGTVTKDQFARFPIPPEGGRPAAVLVLFGADAARDPYVLLTRRASELRLHAGDLAFPGGVVDDGTDRTAIDTALREAREEIGLPSAGVEILGSLPALYLPSSRHLVTPVLAWWRTPAELHGVNAREVAGILRVPLAHLVDPANRRYVRSPAGWVGPGFEVDGILLWGFTAGLLAAVLRAAGLDGPARDLPMVAPDGTPVPAGG